MNVAGTAIRTLRRFAGTTTAERCELCGTDVPSEHEHLLDAATRRLSCSCSGCAALFSTEDGASETRYRRVESRVERLPSAPTEDQWKRLGIPVGLAAITTAAGRTIALFPGPAGVVESDLDPDVTADIPQLGTVAPEVEALLVDRTSDRSAAYRVSIDVCFTLVGLLRSRRLGDQPGASRIHAFLEAVADGRVPPTSIGAE